MHSLGADPKSDRFPPLPLPTSNNGASAAEGQDGQLQTAGDGEEAEVEDRLMARFLTANNDESLTLRIAVNNLHPLFQPGTAEGFFEDLRQREGGEEGVKEAEEMRGLREEGVREGFVMMNAGMKGLTREEVDGRNEGFGRLVAGEAEAEAEGKGEKMEVDE